jgi:hypothetical protein
MALTTIYKVSSYINWKQGGTVLVGGGSGNSIMDLNSLLANYYTKSELQTEGLAIIAWENIVGLNFIDSIVEDSSGVHLDGDDDTPGNSKYYGTDDDGTKGFFDLPTLGSGGVSLSGSTNNTIVTVTGADAIQGEANLTFDGADLRNESGDVYANDFILIP